ncbi:MAG TPA: alpha-hydroxy-acid oxidizing protein [Nitrososphaerales archaeon]|nr:alpha-hydroxy-acid oxidizing protein [Nitrososphaerales archaeon]
MLKEEREETRERSAENSALECVEDYEREAKKNLTPSLINYIYSGTESQSTLERNAKVFSKYLLRRRVLQGVENVDLQASYFGGKIKSELPFFPGPVNVSPLYPNAVLDEIRVAEKYSIPLFISHISFPDPLDLEKLPKLVSNPSSGLIWQIYLQSNNAELCFKQARLAESWGYRALTLTVDGELNVKLHNATPPELSSNQFIRVTPREIKKLCSTTNLPVIIKGVMTGEDAEVAIESGADGVVVSNHGGRMLDRGQATLDVLPEIVKRLKSKKRTRGAEIFFDGGIRRGTDILIALALGARGCLLGRAVLWSLVVDRQRGVENVMRILEGELRRASILCGLSKLTDAKPSIVRENTRG